MRQLMQGGPQGMLEKMLGAGVASASLLQPAPTRPLVATCLTGARSVRGTGSRGTSRGHSHTTPVSVLEASHSVPSSSQPVAGGRQCRWPMQWARQGGQGQGHAQPGAVGWTAHSTYSRASCRAACACAARPSLPHRRGWNCTPQSRHPAPCKTRAQAFPGQRLLESAVHLNTHGSREVFQHT